MLVNPRNSTQIPKTVIFERGYIFQGIIFGIVGIYVSFFWVGVRVSIVSRSFPLKSIYPKYPDPSKVPILRTRTPAIQVQTPPLEGQRILRVLILGGFVWTE